MALLADGRVAVTWIDANDGTAKFQILDPRDGLVVDTAGATALYGSLTLPNELIGDDGNDQLFGGSAGDQLYGGQGSDTLEGGGGADYLDGGAGSNGASYAGARQGVTASLANSAVNTGDAAGDTYVGIVGLIGSAFNDSLVGNGLANPLFGGGGDDTLEGGASGDLLDGATGTDFASYAGATAGVTARLDVPSQNTLAASGDVYFDIEGLIGSSFGDSLVGDGNNNILSGGLGNDTIDGGAGTDTANFSGTQAQSRIGARDGVVITSGPDGVDRFTNIELLQFGAAAAVSLAALQAGGGLDELAYTVQAGLTSYVLPDLYSGPVAGLQYQVLGSATGETILGTGRNDFLNLLGGDDAVDAGAGNDIIDGGTGSNFLTGGPGIDIFFVDGRGGTDTWSTIADWQAGEQLSVFGWKPGISQALWVDSAGAEGFQGVSMFADLDGNGQIDTSVTWTGKTRADLPGPFEFPDLLWFV